MCGHQAILPVDINVEKAETCDLLQRRTSLDTTASDVFCTDGQSRATLHKEAKENILRAQEKQKTDYDPRRAHPATFGIGMLVLKKDFLRKKQKGGRMMRQVCWPLSQRNLAKPLYTCLACRPINQGGKSKDTRLQ